MRWSLSHPNTLIARIPHRTCSCTRISRSSSGTDGQGVGLAGGASSGTRATATEPPSAATVSCRLTLSGSAAGWLGDAGALRWRDKRPPMLGKPNENRRGLVASLLGAGIPWAPAGGLAHLSTAQLCAGNGWRAAAHSLVGCAAAAAAAISPTSKSRYARLAATPTTPNSSQHPQCH